VAEGLPSLSFERTTVLRLAVVRDGDDEATSATRRVGE
jgi:hypothetical protein